MALTLHKTHVFSSEQIVQGMLSGTERGGAEI